MICVCSSPLSALSLLLFLLYSGVHQQEGPPHMSSALLKVSSCRCCQPGHQTLALHKVPADYLDCNRRFLNKVELNWTRYFLGELGSNFSGCLNSDDLDRNQDVEHLVLDTSVRQNFFELYCVYSRTYFLKLLSHLRKPRLTFKINTFYMLNWQNTQHNIVAENWWKLTFISPRHRVFFKTPNFSFFFGEHPFVFPTVCL